MQRLRVIQWTTGFVGRSALRYMLDRDDLEVVGVKAFSAKKAGRDAGDLVRRPPIGVRASADEEELLALDADCVVFTPSDPFMGDPTIPGTTSHEHFLTALRILRSGKNVVSSLCPAAHYHHFDDPAYFIDNVNAACAEGDSSIHYTGVDPGFMTDAMAINLASGIGRFDSLRTWEVLDYFTIPFPDALSYLGFGQRPEDMDREDKLRSSIRVGWGGVPHALAEAFDCSLSSTEVEVEYWLAPESYVTKGGLRVDKGTIAAFHFDVIGLVDGVPVFTTSHVTRMGASTAPDWRRVGHDGGYRIEINGSTPLQVDIPLGFPGGLGLATADAGEITAARVVNCIRPVVAAAPGFLTSFDLLPSVPKLRMRT